MMADLHALIARFANRNAGPITPDTRLQEGLGLDSLAMIDLAVAIEDAFHVRVPDEAAERFRTVGDVTSFLQQALHGSGGGKP